MKPIEKWAELVRKYDGPPLRLMEVCGTHTHRIFQYGIREMLSPRLELISGPGCPVCVTPSGYIDKAAALALEENAVLCTFGDMIRVPGQELSLASSQAKGGKVRIMYSPSDVAEWAKAEPEKTFYVAAVGFETTIPAYALLMDKVIGEKIGNIRLLTSLKALMPALSWICENSEELGGFIGPGHVSAVIGAAPYRLLCRRYGIPLAVAGFSYEHILAAVCDLVLQRRRGTSQVHNLYPEVVAEEGNEEALRLIGRYFVKKDSVWRGLGAIPKSGYFLAPEYAGFDAGSQLETGGAEDLQGCRCGSVIIGREKPADCPHFGKTCTPLHPLGPCMVSTEGACGIWHRYLQEGANPL